MIHGSKEKLDQFVLDIEFLLISIVQGLALAVLAGEAVEPLTKLEFMYWPYIASAFLIILTFWSQAIIHALSFIKWPINITHSFLYFLVSFVEVMTFYHIKNPLEWFGFSFAFFIAVTILYLFDLKMIKDCKKDFESSKNGLKLYNHIYKGQVFDMKILLPAGLIFNGTIFLLILTNSTYFMTSNYHVLFPVLQAFFVFAFLVNSITHVKKRIQYISETF